ncbi:hypothetical protein CON72_24145 [Bacillus wiedmannii]|nr:hypothetical protein CON72_24145 [Bacillus wiedmannii]
MGALFRAQNCQDIWLEGMLFRFYFVSFTLYSFGMRNYLTTCYECIVLFWFKKPFFGENKTLVLSFAYDILANSKG